MDLNNRQIDQYVLDKELVGSKMVFLAGPRQIGKTTYTRSLLAKRGKGRYFNWDNPEVRKQYNTDTFFFLNSYSGKGEFLVVFDEIHKRAHWKDILKGMYDSIDKTVRILVTGSARLDLFRKSGDSLVGRYSLFQMLPLSCAEILGLALQEQWPFCAGGGRSLLEKIDGAEISGEMVSAIDHLYTFGGFPEPFVSGSQRFLTKWKNDYLSLVLTEDLRDLTQIREFDRVENLVRLLPERVGSPLSIGSLAQDLSTNHHTVSLHCSQLERLMLLFFIRPYSRNINRTIVKEPKCYFLNWIYVTDEGKRFENFLAVQLYRLCQISNDYGLGNYGLRYIRNFDGKEIDFLITKDDKPVLCIEAKLSDTEISPTAIRIAGELKTPLMQIIKKPGINKKIGETIRVVSVERLLAVIS